MRVCAFCNKKFFILESSKRRFCSKKCMNKNFNLQNLEVRICPICNKEYAIPKNFRNMTCGKVCGAEKRKMTRNLGTEIKSKLGRKIMPKKECKT